MYTPFDDNDSGKLATTEVVPTMSIRTTHPCHDMPVLNLCSEMTLQKKKNTWKRDFAEVGKSSQMTLRTDFF